MKLMKIVVFAGAMAALQPAFADYSIGYRMGELTKVSAKGIFNKTAEGQLSMGREGTPLCSKNSNGDTVCTNPWYFSGDLPWVKKLEPLVGQYVVLTYRQEYVNVAHDTPYQVTSVSAPSGQPAPTCQNPASKAAGSASDGSRVGRIVKVSTKGTLAKSYEVTFQQGNAGNQFKNMSIDDKKMFDCAVTALKSGKKVRIDYVESYFGSLTKDTSYTIWSIAPIKDLE